MPFLVSISTIIIVTDFSKKTSMVNNKRFRAQALYDTFFFLTPKIRLSKIKRLSLGHDTDESGFTLVELIVVVMMIGILSSIAIPQFMSSADKAKQKEATGIVAALIKAATAYNTEYGSLPRNIGEVSEYAKFQECALASGPVATRGGAHCKSVTPTAPDPINQSFYTSSGNYFVEFEGDQPATSGNIVFRVKANPNGTGYVGNGSAVVGCYDPTSSVSQVFEYTAKPASDPEGRGPGRNWRAPCL